MLRGRTHETDMMNCYRTSENKTAFIDPNIVRAILPSRLGDDYSTLVLDGGVKVTVQGGGPDFMRESIRPAADFGSGRDLPAPIVE
jgi:hypothetical protein